MTTTPPPTIAQFEHVGLRYGTGPDAAASAWGPAATPPGTAPEVLVDIDFALGAGTSCFLAGPSGAGKTSFLRLLSLAERPSRGTVRLFGEDMMTMPRERLPAFRRRIGIVHRDARLVPHLSAAENVALPLRIAGRSAAEVDAAVGEALAWVGLDGRGAAPPQTLSGAERQRAAIARAVVGRPDLLVADEPTASVDPATADRLMQLFAALGRRGTAIVVASHDMRLFTRLPAARLVRLEEGRLRDPAARTAPHG